MINGLIRLVLLCASPRTQGPKVELREPVLIPILPWSYFVILCSLSAADRHLAAFTDENCHSVRHVQGNFDYLEPGKERLFYGRDHQLDVNWCSEINWKCSLLEHFLVLPFTVWSCYIFPLADLAVSVILVPVNIYGEKVGRKIQLCQMKARYGKILPMNEILPGMRVLKLCA